jgi:type IV pilus assembly protein PilE
MNNGQRGFTLVELMIALAIIAVLSAVAIPFYKQYVYQARRAEAQTALMGIAMDETEYYQDNYTYSSLTLPTLTYYSLAFSSTPTATSFTATATAIGSQSKDLDCLTLSINQLGIKSATGSGSNCWGN